VDRELTPVLDKRLIELAALFRNEISILGWFNSLITGQEKCKLFFGYMKYADLLIFLASNNS
jgi:hypothetical protein